MISFRPCDFTDCPVHPDYVETSSRKEDGDLFIDNNELRVWVSTGNHTHAMPLKNSTSSYYNWTSWSSNSADYSIQAIDTNKITDSAIKFNVANTSVSIECLMCKHFKKCDMRELLIVEKAKKELQSDK